MRSYGSVLRAGLAAIVLGSVLMGVAQPAVAATQRNVSTFGSDSVPVNNQCVVQPCRTITRALAVAAAGDTISVGPGTYLERLSIRKGVTIQGAGAAATIIDAANSGPVMSIVLDANQPTFTVGGVTMTHGTATFGGGLQLIAGTVAVNDSVISANSATGSFGGGGGVGVSGTEFATDGRAAGVLSLNRVTVSGNTATRDGAGIFSAGSLTMADTTVTGNRAGSRGGGLAVMKIVAADTPSVTATGTTISANEASSGGGLYATEDVRLHGVTLTGNTAGNGSAMVTSGTTLLNRSTVHANSSTTGSGSIVSSGRLAIVSTTMTDNTASAGSGGLIVTGTTTGVVGSLLSGNSGGSCGGDRLPVDGGYNLGDPGDASCGFTAAKHDVFANPQLGPLSPNGGPTPTRLPSPSSPVVNAIPVGAVTAMTDPFGGAPIVLCVAGLKDQRDVARPHGPACDIGSVEVVAPTLTTQASAGGPIGTSVKDVATLTGGTSPTGTVTFRLYADPNCVDQVFTSTNPLISGAATSGSFAPAAAGTYRWTATYNGDASNVTAASPCNAPGESVTITKATPTLSTQASPSTLAGGAVRDTATLAGGAGPKGTLTFRLYGPDDDACRGQVVFTSTVTVATGNGAYVSGDFSTAVAGTYRWTVDYSGDGNNDAVFSPCNAPNESVLVRPFTPPPFTSTLTGDVTGPVIGPGESVLISSARVVGPITVNPGGALTVVNARVTNGIVANNPAFLSLCGSDVAAPRSNPTGGVVVAGATVPIRIGDPASGCAGNQIAGGASLTGNSGGIIFGSNTVARDVAVNNNSGAVTLKANTVYGVLACAGNVPPPSNAGQPNTASSKTGQCLGL